MLKSKKSSISFILILACEALLATNAFAARSFEEARQAAFAGRRAEAKEICQERLAADPEDTETRTLLGRVHAWDGNYGEARGELVKVVKAKPTNADARAALIDVELWSDRPEHALQIANEGIELNSNDSSLLMRKARALKTLGRHDEAVVAAERSVSVEPRNSEAVEYYAKLTTQEPLSRASFSYTRDQFNRGYEPWQMFSASLSRSFSFGSLVGRVNRASRFDEYGIQFEIDAYPRLREGTYLYLNYGVSGASVFPRYRAGGEIYQSFGGGWEGSLGLRHLQFSKAVVTYYTATLGKYLGNWYFLGRWNYLPDEYGTSNSGSLQIRRYFGDESYVAASFGAGRSVDYRDSTNDTVVLASRRASLDWHQQISGLWYGNLGLGHALEETRPDVFRDQFSVNVGVEKRF